MKEFSKKVLADADKLLACTKLLDYQRIFDHDAGALKELNDAMRALELIPLTGRSSFSSQQEMNTISTSGSVAVVSNVAKVRPQEERRKEILQMIEAQGFSERLDKVYDSFADGRIRPIRKAPHRNGLPFFNAVIAADYSPTSGLHGIFISNSEVISAVLPFPCEAHEWQLQVRKGYNDLDEMTEYVTLLSAGFELP